MTQPVQARSLGAGALLLLVVASCGGRVAPTVPIPSGLDSSPVTSVLLVGDGGLMEPGDPIRAQLTADATDSADRGPTVVAFLGDNVYPAGVREGESEYARDTTFLAVQLGAVSGSGARALFIPGNHDWHNGFEGGLAALDRQAAWLQEADAPGSPVTWLPVVPGCPGPAIVDVGELRLIALDTQWFLHQYERRCEGRAPNEVFDELTSAIDGAGTREVIVLAHHPLRTYGPHGGYFPVDRHLFPLRDLRSWAFVPLPVLGTAYVVARTMGISDQDLEGDANERMREGIMGAIRAARRAPRFYAAGHEHSLQVLSGAGDGPDYHLVSGSASKITPVDAREATRFATSRRGYMKVEVGPERIQLSVIVAGRSAPGDPEGWCLRIDRVSGSEAPC